MGSKYKANFIIATLRIEKLRPGQDIGPLEQHDLQCDLVVLSANPPPSPVTCRCHAHVFPFLAPVDGRPFQCPPRAVVSHVSPDRRLPRILAGLLDPSESSLCAPVLWRTAGRLYALLIP